MPRVTDARVSAVSTRLLDLVPSFRATQDGERTDSPMPRLVLVVPDQPVAVLRVEELRALLRTVERDTGF